MTNQPGEEAADKLQPRCRLQWCCAGWRELPQALTGHGRLNKLGSSPGSWQAVLCSDFAAGEAPRVALPSRTPPGQRRRGATLVRVPAEGDA